MARLFNGTTQLYFSTGDIHDWGYPFTVATWYKPTTLTASCMVFIGGSAAAGDFYRLNLESTGDISCTARQGASTEQFATTASAGVTAGAWHFAAGVWTSGTSRKVYSILTPGATAVTATNVTAASPAQAGTNRISLGARSGNNTASAWYPGALAHTAIWKVSLTDQEIALLGRGMDPRQIRPDKLVMYLPLLPGQASAFHHCKPTPFAPHMSFLPASTAGAVALSANGPTGATDFPPVALQDRINNLLEALKGFVASGGTAWTASPADTVTLTEAVTKAIGLKQPADTVTLTEAVIAKAIGFKPGGDTVALTDAVSKAVGLKSLSDFVTLTENATTILGGNRFITVADVVSLADDLAKALNGHFIFDGAGTAQIRAIILHNFGVQ